MFGKEKKAYRTPDIQKIPLSDDEVTAVSGGIGKRKETETTTTLDTTGIQTGDNAVNTPNNDNGAGNGDVGRGRGRGGGCDGVPYHRTARTFSSGRNSGC